MSGEAGAAAAGRAPGACQLLREQLVEVVSSLRSHVVVMHGPALDGAGDRPVTGALAESPDGSGLLVLAEDPLSR